MQKFFVRASDISDGRIVIGGSDGVHISRALRMAKGDSITVCDMQKREYDCRIVDFTGADHTDAVLEILSSRDTDTEPPCRITVYQALPKSDKMDYIVQKAVELGASEIVPVMTERTVSRPDEKAAEKKLLRWRRIAQEAATQCGRGIIPEVRATVSYADAVAGLSETGKHGCAFMCYEGDGTKPLPQIIENVRTGDIAFLIGAEGGLSKAETDLAAENGIALAGLGGRILRCETASGFVLSCITYVTELSETK